MAQPQTMGGLIDSIYDTAQNVIPTVATYETRALAQEHRQVATAMQAHALAVGNAIGNQMPGTEITIRKQTDFALRDGASPQYALLFGYAQELGRRQR